MSEEQHIRHIKEISETLTRDFGKALYEGRFRLGTSQKVLNLYLKYLWCLGDIPIPPHCPFDAGIIGRAGVKLNWTELDDENEYMALVKRAKITAGEEKLAAWELMHWEPA